MAEYVEHPAHIKMRKEKKKKEETAGEGMEWLNREYNDIDWAGLYNSDKLSSLRVDKLSLYFSHKITFKGKKAEKVAMIKAHIGSLLYNSMERQQPRQLPLRDVRQQETSSLSEVETDSQSDVVDRVVGSRLSSSSATPHRRLLFHQKPAWKHQNMGKSRHGSRLC